MTRLETAQAAYGIAFKQTPPEPFGINDDHLAQTLERAVASGHPIPESFDWWAEMPQDAKA
jgi:hypothetical protein